VYTKTESDGKYAIKASPTFTGDITTPTLKTFTLKTTSGVTNSGVTIDGLTVRNSSNQSVMTVFGDSKATLFEGNIVCEGTISALTLDVSNLMVSQFFPVKPYVAAYVSTEAISYQFGHVTATLTRPNGTGGVFQFNLPTAHPRGTNYLVIAQIRTGATAGQTFSFCSTNVTSAIAFNVWVRNSTMGAMNGDFYVYTVP
jgi:hypothetical protein